MFRIFKLSNHVGFTLIELMLIVSIIAISTGVMIPSFNTFINNQGLKQASEQVINNLRNIQKNALSNQVIGDIENSNQIYWGIYLKASENTYYYFLSNEEIDTNNCESYISMDQTYNLPSNSLSLQNYCVVFKSSDGSASGSDLIIIKSNKNDKFECIYINPFGLVTRGVYNYTNNSCEQ